MAALHQPAVYIPMTLGASLLLLGVVLWPPLPARDQDSEPIRLVPSSIAPAKKVVSGVAASPGRPTPPAMPVATLQALRQAAAVYVPDVFSDAVVDSPPSEFLSNFRNPCWRRRTDGRLRCLPLVHVLGAYQCGAADIFQRLAAHPDFARPGHAQPSFYFEQSHRWDEYVHTFDRAAAVIEEAPESRITGEASAGMLTTTWTHSERLHQPYITTMGERWRVCNSNRSRGADADALFNACMAAHLPAARAADAAQAARAGLRLEVPHLLHAVQGARLRLVALLRNPTHRLWAAYWHYPHYRKRFGASAEGFHKYHVEMAAHFQLCADNYGVDECAMRFESLERRFERVFYHCDQHAKGLYATFVHVWQQAFADTGRDVLLVLRTESYVHEPRAAVARVLRFAGLRDPSEGEWATILERQVATNGKRRDWSEVPPMLDETREAVNSFYQPHNNRLAAALADEAFLWRDAGPPPSRTSASS